MRLRWIHRNLKSDQPGRAPRKTYYDGGPRPKHPKVSSATIPNNELIAELNSSTSESEISRLMKETIEHRNQIRGSTGQSILKIYPKFAELGYLVCVK